MWEIPLHPSVPEKTGRLVKQSSGMSIKGVVASDLGQIGRDRFLLLVSGDGVAEVLHVGGSADFSLLTRFRVVEEGDSSFSSIYFLVSSEYVVGSEVGN